MRWRRHVLLGILVVCTVWMTGCSGGGGSTPTPPPAISVAFSSQAPASLVDNATASLNAVVSNDSKGAGVNWSVTCGSSACGSFNPTSTASGTATTYTAPAVVPTNNTVTVTATSVSDSTKSISATITITVPAITVTLNPTPPTSLTAGTTTSLTAVVANDSKNAGVTWTVSCGSSGCGSFSPASTASGSPTTYTAPSAVPTNNTVSVTATSVTDTTKSASATITITAPAAILGNGTYVYHLAGWDTNGPCFFTGAFTVASGAITGGEQDFSDAKVYDSARPITATGSGLSNVGSNIQIALATANTSLGVNGVLTLHGKIVSGSRVLITEFDSFASTTGSIDLQTSAAAPSGGYAFTVSGWDLSSPVAPFAIGGVLNISGTSVNLTNSVFDSNDGGVVTQAQAFTSGSLTAPDSFGRLTFTLTPNTGSNLGAFILTGYIVGANQIQLVESQQDQLSADLGGVALGQGSNAGQFSQATIANKTYVYAASGQDLHGLTTIAGTFSFNSTGNVSGNLSLNDISFFGQNTFSGANYTVDPTGRVTLTGVSPMPLSTTLAFQLYLDGNGNALEMGVDSLQATAGPAYLQTASSADFEGSYAISGQGFLNSQGQPAWGAVGPVTVSSDQFQNGSTDYNAQGVTPTTGVALTGSENSSTGLLSIAGLNALSITSATSYAYYPIDSTRVAAIEVDGNQIGLLIFEGVSH